MEQENLGCCRSYARALCPTSYQTARRLNSQSSRNGWIRKERQRGRALLLVELNNLGIRTAASQAYLLSPAAPPDLHLSMARLLLFPSQACVDPGRHLLLHPPVSRPRAVRSGPPPAAPRRTGVVSLPGRCPPPLCWNHHPFLPCKLSYIYLAIF
jgi:hypothetical protein